MPAFSSRRHSLWYLLRAVVVCLFVALVCDGVPGVVGAARAADGDGAVSIDQVVLNGGFESGRSHWWGKGGEVSSETAVGGRHSLKVRKGFVAQDKRPVIGGRRYRVSMHIRAEDTTEDAVFVQLSYRGPGVGEGWFGPRTVKIGPRRERAVFVAGGQPGWQRHSVVVEAPSGARELLIYLRKQNGTPGVAYFDEVEIEPTDEVAETAATLRHDELRARLLEPASVSPPDRLADGSVPPVIDGRLVIARDGVSAYRIGVAKDADVVVLHAAGQLADYLQQITGVGFLPLATDGGADSAPRIIVGRDAAAASGLSADIPFDTLGDDGFVIRSAGQHIVIAGATSRGTMYGVNWFLDRMLGVKWLSPDFTVVPTRRVVELPVLDALQRPRFRYREVLSAEGGNKRYRARNLLNGESHGPSFQSSPPEIDVWDRSWRARGGFANFWELLDRKKNGASNPEWFTGGQVAMMDPTVRRRTAEAIIRRLRQHPDYRSIWFDLHDMDWGWDMDAASATFAKAHGGKASAPRLDMVADVTRQVLAALPGARLAFNPYHSSFSPPEGMSVPDEVLVFPMTIQVDYSAPLNRGNNVQLGRDIESWNRIARHVLVWDHIANFSGFLQPTPNIFPIGKSIQWLSGLEQVEGYFAEGSWNTPGAEFAALRVWMIARLLWDPSLDARAVVEEFCQHYYGAAAPAILKYIDLMHEAIRASGEVLAEKTQVDLRMYSLDFVREADRLFDTAEAAVADDAARLKHVRAARMPVDYVALVRRFDLRIEAAAKGVAWEIGTAGRSARLFETAAVERVRQYRQGGALEELRELVAIERSTPDTPQPAEGRERKDWVDFQDLALNRYAAARIVQDPKASDQAAVRIPGNSGGWIVQFKLDKLPVNGVWDLFVRVRVDGVSSGASGAAIRVGFSPPMNLVNRRDLGQVRDGEYRYVKVPGGPFRREVNHNKSVYVQGPANSAIDAVLVDRIVALRATGKD